MKTLFAAFFFFAAPAASAVADDTGSALWSGPYIGVNGAYGFQNSDDGGLGEFGRIGSADIAPASFGVEVGYNVEIGRLLVGLEAGAQASDLIFGSGGSDQGYFGDVRGRIGFTADRLLVYGIGGLALANTAYSARYGDLLSIDGDYANWGYTLGGGIEYAVDDSWSVKLEYLYTRLQKQELKTETLSVGGVTLMEGRSAEAEPDFHMVRLGVNFRF